MKHAINLKLALVLAALMSLSCICGSGCCTTQAIMSASEHYRNEHFLTERIGYISEDNGSLVINVGIDTCHKHLFISNKRTHKDIEYTFSLYSPPKNANIYIFDVVDLGARDQKYKYQPCQWNVKYVNDDGHYRQVNTDKSFLLKEYMVTSGQHEEGHFSKHFKQFYVHSDDRIELHKPFMVYSQPFMNKPHLGACHNFMIPYKCEGNRFYAYSVGNLERNNCLVSKNASLGHGMNCSTVACGIILTPPALVLDVVTLPFQAVLVILGLAIGDSWH